MQNGLTTCRGIETVGCLSCRVGVRKRLAGTFLINDPVYRHQPTHHKRASANARWAHCHCHSSLDFLCYNTPELFTAQLQEGHYNELRVAHFMLKGAHVRIGFSGQRYDLHVLLAGGAGFGVEVKWDKRAGETGNLYFEGHSAA